MACPSGSLDWPLAVSTSAAPGSSVVTSEQLSQASQAAAATRHAADEHEDKQLLRQFMARQAAAKEAAQQTAAAAQAQRDADRQARLTELQMQVRRGKAPAGAGGTATQQMSGNCLLKVFHLHRVKRHGLLCSSCTVLCLYIVSCVQT